MTVGPDGNASAAARAVWWLAGGLGLLVLVLVVLAPQLLGDLPGFGGQLLVVVATGLPGLAIMLVVALRRRGPDADGPDADEPDAEAARARPDGERS